MPITGEQTSERGAAARHPLNQDPARLRRLRIEAGLTITELGQRAGVSFGHIGELERGTRNATPPMLRRLADGLGCKIRDLMAPAPWETARTAAEFEVA